MGFLVSDADFRFISGIGDGTVMLVTAGVQQPVGVPMPVCRHRKRGGVAAQ